MKKNKSLSERLNKKGPSIDPSGTPDIIINNTWFLWIIMQEAETL